MVTWSCVPLQMDDSFHQEQLGKMLFEPHKINSDIEIEDGETWSSLPQSVRFVVPYPLPVT